MGLHLDSFTHGGLSYESLQKTQVFSGWQQKRKSKRCEEQDLIEGSWLENGGGNEATNGGGCS